MRQINAVRSRDAAAPDIMNQGGLMSSETNKAAVRRCWEEAWNMGDVTLLDELYSPDSVHHFGAKPARFGPDQRAAMVKAWRIAIPDYHCHIEDLVAEGDLVVMRLRFTGTHSAAPLAISGRAATPRNRTFEESELLMFRFRDGKILESWATWDRLSFLEQLGAIDKPG
jgi:predicted ester cyclase